VPGVFVEALKLQPAKTKKRRTAMTHKFASGQNVYYEPTFGNAAARGKYKIVRTLPVENDHRVSYRIKSLAETFERIADEHQLSAE
jgi:hypothetical protein